MLVHMICYQVSGWPFFAVPAVFLVKLFITVHTQIQSVMETNDIDRNA